MNIFIDLHNIVGESDYTASFSWNPLATCLPLNSVFYVATFHILPEFPEIVELIRDLNIPVVNCTMCLDTVKKGLETLKLNAWFGKPTNKIQ